MLNRLLIAGAAVLAMNAPRADPTTFAECAGQADPVSCVVRRAQTLPDAEVSVNDRIAAGAYQSLTVPAGDRSARAARTAARAVNGYRDQGLTADEAQRALAIFEDVDFLPYNEPRGPGIDHLWAVALQNPPTTYAVRHDMVWAAFRGGRKDIAGRLVREAVGASGRWTDDERAEFASVAARLPNDWRTAQALMAAGGDRAEGYDAAGIHVEIAGARLREGYNRESAVRVAADLLSDEELLPWPDERMTALKAGGAARELRETAQALILRARNADRDAEDRTDDFGAAAWLLQAAGDTSAALEVAREGALLTPRAADQRLAAMDGLEAMTPTQKAAAVGSFGTWPVRMLYVLGARDEALATGYLAGDVRYRAELEDGGTPDPRWLLDDGDDRGLNIAIGALLLREDRAHAAALLTVLMASDDHGAAKDAEIRLYHAPDLMMLAALAGDRAAVDAIFADGLTALDGSDPEGQGFPAMRLAMTRRAAEGWLPEGDQSP